jgi:hypothetical protein
VRVETVASGAADMIDAATEGMEEHWDEHLDRLASHLAGQTVEERI